MIHPARTRHLACIFWLAGLMLLPGNADTRHIRRIWQADDGLPHNNVRAIAQSAEGYLWVGTGRGLVRFDGVRFTPASSHDSPLPEHVSVAALCADRQGAVWVGTDQDGVFRWQAGRWAHFQQADGLANNAVRSLCEGVDGSIWAGTIGGLFRFSNGKWAQIAKGELSEEVIRAMTIAPDGQLWVGTGDGVRFFDGGSLRPLEIPRHATYGTTRTLLHDERGDLWIGANSGLTRNSGAEFQRFTEQDGLPDLIISALHKDREGILWIGTYGGLAWMDGVRPRPLMRGGQPLLDKVNCLFEDREGTLWVGTSDGLVQLSPQIFEGISRLDGLSHHKVTSVLESRDGEIWISTWGGGLNKLNAGIITTFRLGERRSPVLVLGLCEDQAGALWVGTDYNGGMFRVHDGVSIRYGPAESIVDSPIRVLMPDRENNLWIGAGQALLQMRDGKLFRRFAEGDNLPAAVRSLHQDRNGALWIGTDKGLCQHVSGKIEKAVSQGPLAQSPVFCVTEDESGVLWAGTADAGAHCLDKTGFWRSFRRADGLFSDEVQAILDDGLGFLWMSSSHGVFRVAKNGFDEMKAGKRARLECAVFGRDDGMPSSQCNPAAKPSAWKGRDGRLWFATLKGVAVVDPRRIRVNKLEAEVVIEGLATSSHRSENPEVLFDSAHLLLSQKNDRGNHELILPVGRNGLEIQYTALSLVAANKNRFRYKLEGFDEDWHDAGTRRVAYYNNLPPGHYTFRVTACNNDGLWNNTGAAISLYLQPHFWQTSWFQGLAILVAVGMVAGTARHLTRRKMQRALERLEQQHAVDSERARIARDMHDDLGARLTQILMVLDQAGRAQGQQTNASVFSRASGLVREVIDNMDAMVWAINPRNDSIDRLGFYLNEYASSYFDMTPISCRFDIAGELPTAPISSEERHNLFCVVKEALNNAAKHSKATEVWVRLRIKGDTLRLGVEDNGKGFEYPVSDGMGNGLANMARRMKRIGGEFQVNSRPGKGTAIELSVPLRKK